VFDLVQVSGSVCAAAVGLYGEDGAARVAVVEERGGGEWALVVLDAENGEVRGGGTVCDHEDRGDAL
jgi:hypothetical protein